MSANKSQPNFFVSGKSGSGKDTISNFLWENYGYRKMRLAKTIKQVVCETNNLTPDELEIKKRENPKLRNQHKTTSDFMDENTTNKTTHNLNRLQMLIDGTAYDYELLTKEESNKIVPQVYIDVRDFEESFLLLSSGAIGIFLKRNSDDVNANKGHRTEKSMFSPNGKKPSDIEKLVALFPNQCYIVDNVDDPEILIQTDKYLQFDAPVITGEILCEKVDNEIFKRLIY